jgi:type III secretion protein R
MLAMGAMMVPPMLISLPIKILLFIAVDGWSRLLQSLIMSYA